MSEYLRTTIDFRSLHQDIQFKLHDKFQLFEEANLSKNYVSLVDTSHNTNLLFVGNPLKPELKGTRGPLKDNLSGIFEYGIILSPLFHCSI